MGHVIAHELGHLLMPGQPHSLVGLMRAVWGEPEWHDAIQGALLFSPGQANLIHLQLSRQPIQVAVGN
jgi:hypothetical protein